MQHFVANPIAPLSGLRVPVGAGIRGKGNVNDKHIVHMFLPNRYPDKLQDDLEIIEADLLEHSLISFTKALNESNFMHYGPIQRMLEEWKCVQPNSDMTTQHVLRTELLALKPGDTIPLYVRHQNCTMLISKYVHDGKEKIRIQTFRPNLPNGVVMSGIHAQNMTFPETSNIIENEELLGSQAFVSQICELAANTFPLSMPKRETAHGIPIVDDRDVPDPFLVSDWTLGLLVPREDLSQIFVKKKARDEVAMTSRESVNFKPFRRSGMWMSIKVALHLKFLDLLEGNQENAKLVYKIVMLYILVDACREYQCTDQFDFNLGSQMLAKIGRRVGKLQKINWTKEQSKLDLLTIQIEQMKAHVQGHTLKVTTSFQEKIQILWNNISLPPKEHKEQQHGSARQLTRYELMKDLKHTISPLDELINCAKEILENPMSSNEQASDPRSIMDALNSFQKLKRFAGDQFGNAYFPDKDQERVWLHDIEYFIKNVNHEKVSSNLIFELAQTYISIAKSAYERNPVGFSQLLLVALKTVYIMDNKATKMYPLLLSYQPNIVQSSFDCLLLAHKNDEILLNNLLKHFQLRDFKSARPLLERTVHPSTFSVQFAQQNAEMKSLKKKIQEDTAASTRAKYAEVERVRQECRQLEKEIESLSSCSCRYETQENRYYNRRYGRYETNYRSVRVYHCRFCRLKLDLDRQRKSVNLFEEPLPTSSYEQDAVVFELLIPEEISKYRQMLAILKYELLGEKVFASGVNSVRQAWHKYSGVSKYAAGNPSTIFLGSTVIPLCSKHETNSTPDVLCSSQDDFIVNNGMTCNFHYSQMRPPVENYMERCTFQITDTANPKLYLPLQKYLASFQHFQNDVIANQQECDSKLTPNEFIAFGSLRAGYRVQLRNLYRAIASRSIALENEAVLALVLQSIWQIGPSNVSGIRDSHHDFTQYEFTMEFLDLLQKLMKENESNYSNTTVLILAVFITLRIMELNENCRRRCYELLVEWRLLTVIWCQKIENRLLEHSQMNKTMMKKILLEVKICALLTYYVDVKEHNQRVFRKSEDVSFYLHTITSKRLLEKEINFDFSPFFGIVRFIEKNITTRLGIENEITSSELFYGGFTIFAHEKWPPAKRFKTFAVDRYLEYNHIIKMNYSTCDSICIDLFTGDLLINGYPETEMSSSISNNEDFKRYFQQNLNFRIQRQSKAILRTAHPIQGCHYEFRIDERRSNGLVICEIPSEGQPLFLVPHESFRGILADPFVDNFTHWLDIKKGRVFFRQITSSTSDISLTSQFVLIGLKEGHSWTWKLQNENSQDYVMSINSSGFRLITGPLARFELQHFMNISTNKNVNTVQVYLTRHNLRFIYDQQTGILESVEYPNYKVSCNQDYSGVFVGFRNGLLLENGAKRNMIVPHGSIIVDAPHQPTSHCNSHIDRNMLFSPSFYIYEFDDVLRRVVGKNNISSWLYLAALHAVTSSGQPDPFTGLTGTEMAISILQSARVWSCSPYDIQSLRILNFIKNLAPKRNFYGHEMGNRSKLKKVMTEDIETMQWPRGISSTAAFDGYPIIVDYLISSSTKLAKLHPIKENCKDFYLQHQKSIKDGQRSHKLCLRAYLRNSNFYNDEVQLSEDVVSPLLSSFPEQKTLLEMRLEISDLSLASLLNTAHWHFLRSISGNLALNNNSISRGSLASYLLVRSPISQAATIGLETLTLGDLLNINPSDFRKNWLSYYSLAISNAPVQHKHEFNILLCALAYRGVPLEQIQILNRIIIFNTTGKATFPPVTDTSYVSDPTKITYVISEISSMLEKNARDFPLSESDFDSQSAYKCAKYDYDYKIRCDCNRLAQLWSTKYWPCSKINLSTVEREELRRANIYDTAAIREVNILVATWFEARKLSLFVNSLQLVLDKSLSYSLSVSEIRKCPSLGVTVSNIYTASGEVESYQLKDWFLSSKFNHETIAEAKSIFQTGKINLTSEADESVWIREAQDEYKQKILSMETKLVESMCMPTSHKVIYKCGLAPRIVPISLLKSLQASDGKHENLSLYVGALGVLWANLKRLNRCSHFELLDKQADVDKEMANVGHENWSPEMNPDWLLLELELDITIRKVQIDVARQMMSMPNGGNGVTQLNMGEGKTSVIVPMLCASLSRGDVLCRATVLSSIFKMNWAILKFAIGGLLNRRLYSFPCRRDMGIDEECVKVIQTMYKECLERQGTVLTLPEYRLSFRSLAYDKILNREVSLGLKLLEIEDWLRGHAKDILDESDELLNVKYQLVYTIGDQIKIDGGEVRWLVCQHILDAVQEIAPGLLKDHGSACIEFEAQTGQEGPHEFANIRLLTSEENLEFHTDFERRVAETYLSKYLKTTMLSDTQKQMILTFLREKNIDVKTHTIAMNFMKSNPMLLKQILTLAGYIHRGVLILALSKRWRVEYGVNPKGPRKMAVPFRAKDVAAERTEFGHIDLAIILTHLSYYYSGLSNTELEEVFYILSKKSGPEAIYSKWISNVPSQFVHESLNHYQCLNLKDSLQKAKLFNLIRKHKMVVDFWLSNSVFPLESKQFPGKLVMTAWDLVYERHKFPTTGFSGTNDSGVLLPLTISQQDLPHLHETNQKMEKVLLKKENFGHKKLEIGVTCDKILEMMKLDTLRILIDCGALMLDLDNEQVAERWLEVDPRIEASIYFNKDNELMVKSRERSTKSADVPFELSPFNGKLEKCGVFLDDQHTRGTDLRFPMGSSACVTIGSRMKREKLLQACMRMRRLAIDHSVTFYLSHEASHNVDKLGQDLSTSRILDWVKQNTKDFNDDGLLYWAIAGKNYAQRLAAEDTFHFPYWKEPYLVDGIYDAYKAGILANQCKDEEVTSLLQMYGQHSKQELLVKLIRNWFSHTETTLHRKNGVRIPTEITIRFYEICGSILERCNELIPNKTQLSSSTMMDEEQEKELELEKEAENEEEQEREKPPACTPATPYLHPNVVKMVLFGEPFRIVDGVMRLSDVFMNTSFAKEVQPEHWAVQVYATNDFISVISPTSMQHFRTDYYLRPIEFLASHKQRDGSIQILLLSSYEVNELIVKFWRNESKNSLLMFSARMFERQDMLLNIPRLQLPVQSSYLGSKTRERAALLLASGSLYFNSMEEQKTFADFLWLVPRPWNKRMGQMFHRGMITNTGFLRPQYRQYLKSSLVGFPDDPAELVFSILNCRHFVLGDISHIVRLLNDKTFIQIRDQDENLGITSTVSTSSARKAPLP